MEGIFKILKKSIAIPIMVNHTKKDLNKISETINNFFKIKNCCWKKRSGSVLLIIIIIVC